MNALNLGTVCMCKSKFVFLVIFAFVVSVASASMGSVTNMEPKRMSERHTVIGSGTYNGSTYETCRQARLSAERQASRKCLELGFNGDWVDATFGKCPQFFSYAIEFEFNCIDR